ncbi:PAS domain S-box protein [Pseudodesulfovibrio cashew]|uniref:histidine kinase n=2 Tax=Pseudodesulfovibrio cashew TaxID=2678688 RepID=A0A6I6JLW4_9BACT|nr:PAS domain S-box protein [Pseudodesulfovibrio cashew]
MFRDRSNEELRKEIGIVAAALPGETVLPEAHDGDRTIPTYAGYKAMLDSHPEINMIIEATGRKALVHELRTYLPPSVVLVERGAANFFINLLTENKIWVACKLDLLHTQNMLKTIIDQMEHEILFLDRKGMVLDANQTVLMRTGLTKKTIIGQPYCDLFLQSANPKCGGDGDPFAATMRTGQPSETVTTAINGDGRVQYFRVYTHPVQDEDKEVSHVVAVRRDITRRASIENRLQQAERLASIGELSTYMAHEIRNPLFTISGFANSLMREPDLDTRVRSKLGIILDEARRLEQVLNSLMRFTRPAGVEVAEVDLAIVARETMDVMALPCQNQNVRAELDLPPDMPLVKANPDLIKQCLSNMVKNSLEAMEDGGELRIAVARVPDGVSLSVADTGHGIPPEIRDKIFSPFFSTKDKGSGLGLAQTRMIVDEIGGSLDLASKVGAGTTITLTLPPLLAVAEAPDSE